jgi:hypothetical protein
MESDNTWSRTFYVNPPTISYEGMLFYEDGSPGGSTEYGAGCLVEMWDDEAYPLDDQLLDSYITDQDGHFLLGPVQNDNDWNYSKQDIYFRFYATNQACRVVREHDGERAAILTPVKTNHPSGQFDTLIYASEDESDLFVVSQTVKQGYDFWRQLVPSAPTPDTVEVVVDSLSNATFFNPQDGYIVVGDLVSIAARTPDTHDRSCVLHEYGHWLEFSGGLFDSNEGGDHYVWSLLSPGMAGSEGFASYFACAALSDSIFCNTYRGFLDTFWINLENGEYGHNSFVEGSVNHFPDREFSVAGLFWDICDDVDDDYSTFGVTSPLPWFPDGRGDSLTVTTANLMSVCLDSVKSGTSGTRPDNIEEFWQSWFVGEAEGGPPRTHPWAMLDIAYEHGINYDSSGCCGGLRDDLNHSGAGPDISDLVYFVTYMFQSGPPPLCFYPEADINGRSGANPDISDLVYLVTYMFVTGPEPAPCKVYPSDP